MIKKRERKVFSIFSHFQIGVDSARVDGFFSWVKLLLSGDVIDSVGDSGHHHIVSRRARVPSGLWGTLTRQYLYKASQIHCTQRSLLGSDVLRKDRAKS